MIEFITYKEKQLPIRVSYYALKMTSKEAKEQNKTEKMMELEDILKGEIEIFEPLLFFSLEAGHRAQGKLLEIKREEIPWVLDECYMEFAKKIPSFFQDGGQEARKPSNNRKQTKGRKKMSK